MSLAREKPFLVAIILILCVPVTLCTAFVIWYLVDLNKFARGDGPLAEISVAQVAGLTLELERHYAHPFLAEYKRALSVTDSRGVKTRHDLGNDPGGGGRLTVCQTATGDILLTDPFYAYRLSAEGQLQPLNTAFAAKVMPDGGMKPVIVPDTVPGCVKPLGAFDSTGDKSYGFVPA